jgi:hypothetical protein
MRDDDVTPVFLVPYKLLFSLLVLLLLVTGPIQAQIDQKSVSEHRQQRKKFLKQAANVDSKYNDTHLNVDSHTFKIGESGRRRVRRDDRATYQFNENGQPLKKQRFLFLRRKKNRTN